MSYVENRVYFRTKTPEDAAKLVSDLRGADITGRIADFTFNRFVRMPHELSFDTPVLAEVAADFLTEHPEGSAKEGEIILDRPLLELGRRALQNEARYGARTAEAWCEKHWGTPLDAMDVMITTDENRVMLAFQSSGSVPRNAARAMRRLYGTALVHWLWCDEKEGQCNRAVFDLKEAGFFTDDLIVPVWHALDVTGYDDI